MTLRWEVAVISLLLLLSLLCLMLILLGELLQKVLRNYLRMLLNVSRIGLIKVFLGILTIGILDMIKCDYFPPEEFRRCTPKCDKSDMDSAFMERLNRARRVAGIPFVLNSAFRSTDWEISHKRSGTSMHVYGRAVDIKCLDSASRAIIVSALLSCGFTGIGIANTFIHVDDRSTKLIWLYE